MDKQFFKEFINLIKDDPNVVILIGIGIGLFLLLLIVDSLTSSYRVLKKAKKILASRQRTFATLDNQARAISDHASSYSNTLGGEGAKLISELATFLDEQQLILSSLELATKNWDIEEILRIEEDPTISDNEVFINKIKRADTIIQYISGRIVEASLTATKLHIPKIRKAQSTMESLSRMGLTKITRAE